MGDFNDAKSDLGGKWVVATFAETGGLFIAKTVVFPFLSRRLSCSELGSKGSSF